MTESEIIDAITSYQEVSLSATALYMTILSGYLVTAYVAGKNLSRVQITIVNALFFFSSSMAAYGSVAYTERTAFYTDRLEHLVSGTTEFVPSFNVVPVIWAIVLGLGILSAYFFMWSVRRK